MRGIESVTARKGRKLVTKIEPLILFVSNFSECFSFYRKALGLSLKRQVGELAEFDVGGLTFALHGTGEGDGPTSRTQDAPLAVHLVTDDIGKVKESIEAWGSTLVKGPEEKDYDSHKVLEATFIDPGGNQMEIVQYLKTPDSAT